MTTIEKRNKAIAIAVAYFLEQERAELNMEKTTTPKNNWMLTSRSIQMNIQQTIQQRANINRARTALNREESLVLN